MSNYNYTAGRPVRSSYVEQPEVVRYVSSESNDYSVNSYEQNGEHSAQSDAIFRDPTSPFFGMDPQLVGFVQKHNVEMGDGAVLNMNAMKEKAAWDAKQKKTYTPPCGLTLCQFVTVIVLVTIGSVLLIAAIVIGLVFGLRLNRPSYPRAQPWWRRTQMYQINVATWANDVGGATGRLQDVTPRMAYLATQIGADSIVLTELLAQDQNGITNWTLVNSAVALADDAIQVLIPELVTKANKPLGGMQRATPITILLGMPLYATSDTHEWFRQSRTSISSRFSSFYIWSNIPPVTGQDYRYWAKDNVRNAYYRHVHGNLHSPLLNLTNPEVQMELNKTIQYWKKHLQIKGIMITNSSNILPEMVPAMRSLLDSAGDDQFVWFADQPKADALVNPRTKVCFFDIAINRRVPTRANDLVAQIGQAMNETLQSSCSPIWRVVQRSQDNKDYRTIQQIAHFLPGSFLMVGGQEVDLTLDGTELISWSYQKYNDYTTYWPRNVNLERDGLIRLLQWRKYWTAASEVSILAAGMDVGRLVVPETRLTENLFVAYRVNQENADRVYFVVSFQTLNTLVQFSSIFHDLPSPTVEVSYDTKDMYTGRRKFGETTLVNNQVLLLYYY